LVAPVGMFQCGVVTTRVQPATAALAYQSAAVTVPVEVVPSVYVTVTAPDWVPLLPTARKDRLVPDPPWTMSWPFAVIASCYSS